MEKFITFKGIVAPMDRPNVDTDAIIPKQFLKSIKRSGFGPNLFDEWRYLDIGEPDSDNSNRPLNKNFVLNKPRYKNAQILLTRDNFGCGSSREHAPWALLDYGFKVIIAPSYADIFFNNCYKNGILPVIVENKRIDSLFETIYKNEGFSLNVDLEAQSLTSSVDDSVIYFDVDLFRKKRLLEGLDDIGLTLQYANEIKLYEKTQKNITPWLF
ncbi:MAG: 3-isopropylmalate dehydratase small subunit [Thiohalomonadales bacterium]